MKKLLLLVAATATVLLYQNCSGFNSQETAKPSSATNPSSSKDAVLYFGRTGGIDGIRLDLASGAVTPLPSVTFSGGYVGWMHYDKSTRTVFAGDESSTRTLQLYSYAPSQGALTSLRSFTLLSQATHLFYTAYENVASLFVASYNDGKLEAYKLGSKFTNLTPTQTFTYAAGAKAHASAFDAKRGLLFVTTLGLNNISVYYYTSVVGLTPIGNIPVTAPRTVVYDAYFDKLYVSTEERTAANSYIHAFSVQYVSGGTITYANEGSQAMPMAGSDIKVNRKYRYVFALAREAGKESLWGMRLTVGGAKDNSRLPINIPVNQPVPRSLEITDDGRYAIVGMSDNAATESVVIFKLDFDAGLNLLSSPKIYGQKLNGTSNWSTVLLPGG